METANRPLNYQAIELEEAEAKIRLIVKTEYLKGTPRSKINRLVLQVIDSAIKKITLPVLKEAGRKSLINFYNRQYMQISQIRGSNLLVLLAIIKLNDSNSEIAKNMPISRAKAIVRQQMEAQGDINVRLYGSPMQKFSKDYMEKNVKPILDRLTKQFSLDPDDITGRNSLRNRCEMEVRYNGHLENIEQLKAQGNKLVIASSHADCSERCQKWQGRVYSLDGTSGVAPDGRKYVPLEKATDVYYTTKAGKTYKNGLLGFNCRHYLVAYKDNYKFPKVSAEEEREQYKITLKQRELERDVRYWRTQAIESKGVDAKAYSFARQKAIDYNKKYIAFSKANSRAYYPSRTKII